MSSQNEILKELESLQSPLGAMPRTMPYSVPEGYFDALPQQMTKAVQEDAFLASLPNDVPYQVPANYFEQLPSQILNAVKASEQKQKRVIAFKPAVWNQVKLAAAALILLAAGLNIIQNTSTPSFKQQLSALPEDVVTEYVQQNIDEFDAELLERFATVSSSVPSADAEQMYLNEDWQ